MTKYTSVAGQLYMDALGEPGRAKYVQPVYAPCVIWVPGPEEVFEQQFAEVRRRLGLRANYEFHATQITKKMRSDELPRRFFESLREVSITFEAWVVEVVKERTSLPIEVNGKRLTYELVGRILALMPRECVAGVTLTIDEQVSDKKASTVTREMRAHIRQVMEQKGLEHSVGPVRARPAHQKGGLQLADMLAAAIVKPWPECTGVLGYWSITHWRA
jgi:hypothetical protein